MISRTATAQPRFTFGPQVGIMIFDSRVMKAQYDSTMPMYGGEVGLLLSDRVRLGILVTHGTADTGVVTTNFGGNIITQKATHARTVINFDTMVLLGDTETWPVLPFLNIGIGAALTRDITGPLISPSTNTLLMLGRLDEHTRLAGHLGIGIDIKPLPQLSIILGAKYIAIPIRVKRNPLPGIANYNIDTEVENLGGSFIFFSVMANLP